MFINNQLKYIIVNATALDKSGALSILKQFIDNIHDDGCNWLLFVSNKLSLTTQNNNIRIEPISDVKSMHKRLWWDTFGINKWLKINNIEPIACVSLQNTGFRVAKNDIPKFIYYHQSIPFYPYKWNIFKREHRPLWFYKYIYPFFVKLFLTKDTTVFVQLDFIRNGFARRYKHPLNKIEVYSPSILTPSFKESINISLDGSKLNLFYPATDFFYKNHQIIIDAINECDDVKVFFTIPHKNLGDKISCIGSLPYDEVCQMYKSCDALLFPSYIETFGLPLIEAALTGLPILAADLPYAREVLDGYEGVRFVKYNSKDAWAEAISELKKGKRYKPIDLSNRQGWQDLMKSIKSKL